MAMIVKRAVNFITTGDTMDPSLRAQRTKAQATYARLDEYRQAARDASVKFEEARAQIFRGDHPEAYILRFDAANNDARHLVTVAEGARKFLLDTAPVDLVTKFRKLKRELVQATTRCNSLTHVDIPAQEESVKLCEANLANEVNGGAKPSAQPNIKNPVDISRSQLREAKDALKLLVSEHEEIFARVCELQTLVNDARESQVNA